MRQSIISTNCGWDFTCRSIGQLFEELGLTSNAVVTNQPGEGGGVPLADVAANRNDNSVQNRWHAARRDFDSEEH